MKISILTDEISADPETAIELGVQWGIHDFELRGYFLDRAPNFSAYQKLRLSQVLERYQANIIAISPGLFKFPFPADKPPEFPMPWLDQDYFNDWHSNRKLLEYHLNELLPASLDLANELGAQTVVSFGFSRGKMAPGPPPDELLNTLLAAAERTQSAGLQLAIENEDGFWAGSAERTASIIQEVNHPCLGVNWDPANAYFEGDVPYPDGYQYVKGWVRHVHFKDARRNAQAELEYSIQGEIDWAGQIRALKLDGYSGFVCVETHLRPKVWAARTALNRLQKLLSEDSEQ